MNLPLPLRNSNSGLCFRDKNVWLGVGSGSSRSHHLAMVEQGFEPERGGSSQGVLLPAPSTQDWGQGRAGGSFLGKIGPSHSGPAYTPLPFAPSAVTLPHGQTSCPS